jgi:hypothetical protein
MNSNRPCPYLCQVSLKLQVTFFLCKSDSLWTIATFIWRLMTELHWWQTRVRVRIHAYPHIYKQERDKSHDLNLLVISVVTRCAWLRKPININPFSATKITQPPRHVLVHLKLSYMTDAEKALFIFYDQKIDRRAIIHSVDYHHPQEARCCRYNFYLFRHRDEHF